MPNIWGDRRGEFANLGWESAICQVKMAEKRSIVVLGSINMDLVMVTPRIPDPGETMHGTSFESHPGGKGLNQAVACQRLLPDDTWKTVMISRVGDDEFSGKLKNCLKEENVEYSEVTIAKGKASGVALILVVHTTRAGVDMQVDEKSGQNRIILSANDANASITPEDVDSVSPIIQSASILLCQLEIPLDAVERAISIAHSAGVTTILNPAPAIPHIPHTLLRQVDYLIPNETEASIMLGDFPVDSLSAAIDGAQELIRRGVRKAVLITLGDKGVVIVKNDGGIRTFHARAEEKVVDTTGAGDCFVGGFAVGLVERGLQVEGAAHIGLASAALAIQKKGARDSMPYRKQLSWAGH